MTSLKLLDESHLFALTGGDAAMRDEVLRLFLESARENISQLQSARTGDAWRRSAHRLKGLAASVGAQTMAELAARATVGQIDPEILRHLTQTQDALSQLILQDESRHPR